MSYSIELESAVHRHYTDTIQIENNCIFRPRTIEEGDVTDV